MGSLLSFLSVFQMRVRAAHISVEGKLRTVNIPIEQDGWPDRQVLTLCVGESPCFTRTCGLAQGVFFASKGKPAYKTHAALFELGWLSPVLHLTQIHGDVLIVGLHEDGTYRTIQDEELVELGSALAIAPFVRASSYQHNLSLPPEQLPLAMHSAYPAHHDHQVLIAIGQL